MMRSIAVVLCIASLSAPASAATMQALWTGTLFATSDPTRAAFGGGQTENHLDGDAFSLAFLYDTSIGNRSGTPGLSDILEGGTVLGAPTPVISATLTVNGVSAVIGGQSYGVFEINDLFSDLTGIPGPQNFLNFARDFTPGSAGAPEFYHDVYISAFYALGIPGSLDTPFTPDLTNAVVGGAYELRQNVAGANVKVFANFRVTGLEVTCLEGCSPAVIPLPATALLLGVALLGLGATSRFRTT